MPRSAPGGFAASPPPVRRMKLEFPSVPDRNGPAWPLLLPSRMTAMHDILEQMETERDPHVPLPPRGDLLPSSDGVPMETERHRDQMNLLIGSLAHHWDSRADFYVGGNMFVYFSETQARRNDFRGPDVFVVLDTEKKERERWVAWEEDGKLPDVVIELLSDSTREKDRGEKKHIYERRWKVGAYVMYDPFSHELEGHHRVDGRFVPIEPDADGDLAIPELGLSLGKRDGVMGNYRGPILRWLQDGVTVPDAAEAANARADRERDRAEQERARADGERARADEERARAEEHATLVTSERTRAEAAERRIAELEALLARR